MKKDGKEVLRKFTIGVNKRYLYRDIIYDENGIDYNKYLKLRLTTFDNEHDFIKEYTPEGFKILWHLMVRAKESIFITTTLTTIMNQLDMTRHKVIKGVNALIKSEVIEVYSLKDNALQKIEEVNVPINIVIKYQNDELYDLDVMNGYKSIPFDFAQRIITDLDEKEFTMFMFLVTRSRYFQINSYMNEEGNMSYFINKIMYAYPTQTQISEKIGVERRKINIIANGLVEKGYIKVNKTLQKTTKINNDTGKNEIKNMNDTYEVMLINRPEYMVNQVMNVAEKEIDKLPKETKNHIKSSKPEDLLIENYMRGGNKFNKMIEDYLYIKYEFGKEIYNYKNEY